MQILLVIKFVDHKFLQLIKSTQTENRSNRATS